MKEQSMVKKIGKWLSAGESFMPSKDYSEAKHLFDHDEWEIAFEIFLISMMDNKAEKEKANLLELEQLAQFCQLDVNGGHSDYYVWQNFQTYKSTYI